MTRKPSFRLVLLLNALLLAGLSLVKVPSAEASLCSDCRRQCIRAYQQCIAIGLLGCEEVLGDCIDSCPCP
jgi:hypothetical protein